MPCCKNCGETRADAFYSGVGSYCKDHWKERVRRNRQERSEQYRKYEQSRAYKPHRVALRKKQYAENRNDPEYKRRQVEVNRLYRAKYPERDKARNAVNNAIRDGKLVKGVCGVCGDSRTHGHHDDYSKPLNVRWLCDLHHKEVHANMNRGKSMPVFCFVTNSGSVARLGKFIQLKKEDLRKYTEMYPLHWIEV